MQHSRQEDIQRGIVHHRHSFRRMQQVLRFAFLQHFAHIQVRHLTKRLPLLRSMEAISKQAVRIVKLFGMDDVKNVSCSVGPEQEYFPCRQR